MFSQFVQLIEKVDDAGKDAYDIDTQPVIIPVHAAEYHDDANPCNVEATAASTPIRVADCCETTGLKVEQLITDEASASRTPAEELPQVAGTSQREAHRPVLTSINFTASDPPATDCASATLVGRCARAESALEAERIELSQMHTELSTLRAELRHCRSILERVESERRGTLCEPADDHRRVELGYEVRNLLENSVAQDQPVQLLERTITIYSETIHALRATNVALREQLISEEEDHTKVMDQLRQELAAALAANNHDRHIAADHEKKNEELRRMTAKALSLQAAVGTMQQQIQSQNEQVAILTNVLATRDAEMASLSVERAQLRDLEKTRIYQAMSNRWWGPSVQRAATALDLSTMHLAKFLRKNAVLRLVVALYAVVLHVYVFHLVASVVHLMPHVGHDVHDHISNHLK